MTRYHTSHFHGNRFMERLVGNAQRCRVASFLAGLARRLVARRAGYGRSSSEATA